MGRQKVKMDWQRFRELYNKYEKGIITQSVFSAELGLSRATLNRRISEYRMLNNSKATIRKQIFNSENDFVLDGENVADGRELLRVIADDTVAAVFFDPEYAGSLTHLRYGNLGARHIRRAALPQMSNEVISEMICEIARVLRPAGYLFLWCDKFILVTGEFRQWVERTTLQTVDCITWNKLRMGMGARSRRVAEYLIVMQQPPLVAKKSWLDHSIPDVWQEKTDTTIHPHSKPIGLQTALIIATTDPSDVVLDPAAGSYSVLEACRRAERIFLGSDILENM